MPEPIATPTTTPATQPPAGGGVPTTGASPTPVVVLPQPPTVPPGTPTTAPVAVPPPAIAPEVMAYIQRQQQELAQVQQALRQMQGQFQPQPQPQQPQANPFGVTPWDRSLEQYLTQDDKGNITETAGAPPGTAARYVRHQQEKRAAVEALLTDPMRTLAPLIQQQAQVIAQQQMAAQQDAHASQVFIQQNADWLYTGQKELDHQGRMVDKVSDAGLEFMHHVAYAQQMGVHGTANIIRYASGMLTNSAMQRRQQNTQFTPQQMILARKLGVLEQQAAPAAGLPNTQVPAPAGHPNGQANVGPHHTLTPLRARVAAMMTAGQR